MLSFFLLFKCFEQTHHDMCDFNYVDVKKLRRLKNEFDVKSRVFGGGSSRHRFIEKGRSHAECRAIGEKSALGSFLDFDLISRFLFDMVI